MMNVLSLIVSLATPIGAVAAAVAAALGAYHGWQNSKAIQANHNQVMSIETRRNGRDLQVKL